MRNYNQLTKAERVKAIEKALEELTNCAANGLITFGKKLQSKIDFAIKLALDNNMQWSIQEHILEVAKIELVLIAKSIAEDAKYKDDGDFIKEEQL